MTREIIATDSVPHPDAPISQAVRVGQLVFVSGITPFTREMRLAKGDFAAQMHQVMANLDAILSDQIGAVHRISHGADVLRNSTAGGTRIPSFFRNGLEA